MDGGVRGRLAARVRRAVGVVGVVGTEVGRDDDADAGLGWGVQFYWPGVAQKFAKVSAQVHLRCQVTIL